MRYPTKTSTKEFCDTIAASIARYEKYRYWASKVLDINMTFWSSWPWDDPEFVRGTTPGSLHILHSASPVCPRDKPSFQRIAKGAGGKGPRQKTSKSVKKFFDTFRQFSRRAKNVKNRQKVSKSFSTLFDNFRAAPFFRPLLQSAEVCPWDKPGSKGGRKSSCV